MQKNNKEKLYLPGTTRERIQDLLKEKRITQAALAKEISSLILSYAVHGRTMDRPDYTIFSDQQMRILRSTFPETLRH